MRKLANAFGVFGWALLALGIIIGLWLASTPKPDDFFEAFARFGFGVLPGALLLLLCLAHKHYLTVARKIDEYLSDQMSRPTSRQFNTPAPNSAPQPSFEHMPPVPPRTLNYAVCPKCGKIGSKDTACERCGEWLKS